MSVSLVPLFTFPKQSSCLLVNKVANEFQKGWGEDIQLDLFPLAKVYTHLYLALSQATTLQKICPPPPHLHHPLLPVNTIKFLCVLISAPTASVLFRGSKNPLPIPTSWCCLNTDGNSFPSNNSTHTHMWRENSGHLDLHVVCTLRSSSSSFCFLGALPLFLSCASFRRYGFYGKFGFIRF